MPNMKEKRVRVRFIREQLELVNKKNAELSTLCENCLPEVKEFLRGCIVAKSEEATTLTHLLENCAE